MSNPIKASDLYQDDGAIQEAIKQMEALRDVYVKNLDAITKEAEKLFEKLNKVNTTTREGQETTRNAATDAEKLKKAQKEYASALNETNTKIRQLRDAKRKAIKIQQLEAKVANNAEGSYDRLSAQYSLNKLKLNAMSKAQREATESGRKLEKQTKDIYEEMNRLQKATGKHTLQVGNYGLATKGLKSILTGLIGTFGIIEATRFLAGTIKDSIELARQAKGVEFAFNQLANGLDFLNKAREATRGLLTDLDIKKAANEFNNFNLDVEKLPGLLQFVAVRAAQTGKSFDNLRDSLVEGLSKQSLLRIDNLGISAAEINKQLEKTPDFLEAVGIIAQREVAKAGDILDKAANDGQRFSVALENAQLKLGKLFSDRTGGILGLIALQIERIGDGFELLDEALDMVKQGFEDFTRPIIQLINDTPVLKKIFDQVAPVVVKLIEAFTTPRLTVFAQLLQHVGAVLSGLGSALTATREEASKFVETLAAFADIDFNPLNPVATFKSAKQAFVNAKNQFLTGGKNVADAFRKGYADAFIKVKDDTDEVLDQTIKSTLKSVNDYNAAIQNLQNRLNQSTNRAQAAEIQAEIKALERKRDAILGVANANLKEAASRDKEKQSLLLDVMPEGQDKDIAKLEIDLEAKRKLWEKYGLDVKQLEDYAFRERNKIYDKYFQKALADVQKTNQELQKKNKERYDAAAETIEQEYELRLSEIDILKVTEAEKTRLRLEAEKDRLNKILKLNQAGEAQLSKLQIDTIKNTISKIDQELSKAGSEQKDIYEMVGLKLDDDQKAAISESLSFALNNVQAFLDARVQAAEIAVQKAQEETAAAESRYQAEIEARNNGYANQVLQAQRELELNRKKEQQALKDKEKAQKAQEAIDTAMQISGLITSSVQIWKSLSGIPIVGPALAAAAIGIMFASFAASKIKAKSVAKEKYGEGGLEFLEGGSHASGNDIPIGSTPRGKQRTAEGGEALAIIKKTSTRKYKKELPGIIDSLNKGTFEQTYSKAFISGDEMPSYVFNSGFDSPDLKNIEDDLGAIRKRGETQRYTDANGNLVEVYKNIKRTYV